jgi:hypothetical protein
VSNGAGEGRSPTRILTLAGLIVGLMAGAVGLLFTLLPNLKPCLGASDAAFTGAPVFPRSDYRQYLEHIGVRREDAEQQPRRHGAEIRFSYRTSGFRGDFLPVRWSLLTVEPDGTLGAVVTGQDRFPALLIKPQACSEIGGSDLFVDIPVRRRRTRYQVVLELYRDRELDDRLTLTRTAVFRG